MNADEEGFLESWIEAAPADQREFRQAVLLILSAIESDAGLREVMVLKGGILMALRYRSRRFTTDIDFSTTRSLREVDMEKFRERFKAALAMTVAESDYGLDCRVQTCRIQPPNRPEASFPSINMTVGHAYQGSPKHRKLLRGGCPTTLSIDFSLNERILEEDELETGDGTSIRIYAFSDLVAEKLRSLLQQPSRNRYRRQDVYDLNLLLEDRADEEERAAILRCLRDKARSRGIEPEAESLAYPEVKHRAKVDYPTLAAEVEGELPDFEKSYERIEEFYRSLPWANPE
jgi:predicted nucleotidyltransferase component of viral defense system